MALEVINFTMKHAEADMGCFDRGKIEQRNLVQ